MKDSCWGGCWGLGVGEDCGGVEGIFGERVGGCGEGFGWEGEGEGEGDLVGSLGGGEVGLGDLVLLVGLDFAWADGELWFFFCMSYVSYHVEFCV